MTAAELTRTSWVDRAACRGLPTDLFYPSAPGGFPKADARYLVAFCASCPVIARCHAEAGAGAEHIRYGVWAGWWHGPRRAPVDLFEVAGIRRPR